MCDSENLVLLLLEGLLDLIELRSVANRCLELCDLRAVCFEAVGKRVCEISGVENKDIVARLS